jgi:hypothetical protein
MISLPFGRTVQGAVIDITPLPAYGAAGTLEGAFVGADPAAHVVAPYIQIEGSGWWPKPTEAEPTVPINLDGSFSAPIGAAGLDEFATIYCAAVVPTGSTPPFVEGTASFPPALAGAPVACRHRQGPTLDFAGRTWSVKEAPMVVGPGDNLFSADAQDVFVDGNGLHLTNTQRQGTWHSTEVFLTENLGYGAYAFQTSSRVDILDANAVFGAFTWDPFGDETRIAAAPHREIDFEDSRWGDPANTMNGQMVVQPFDVPGNLHPYAIPDLSTDAELTRLFIWRPGRGDFTALRGHHDPLNFPAGAIINSTTYVEAPALGHIVPTPGQDAFRFNLWLFGAAAPANGLPVEVVINDFHFTPLAMIPEPSSSILLLMMLTITLSFRALRCRNSRD